MTESSIPNPLDRFFKQTFSRLDVTRGFLKKFLPDDVTRCLDLETLELQPTSFVDDELREVFSDLVFTLELAGSGREESVVYLLFEHKSTPDRLVAFQLLKYVVRIGEQRLRDGLPLCCVLPIVVYHGVQPWNGARTLTDLVDCPPELTRFVPDMSLELFDLSRHPDEQLRDESLLQAVLMLLKYIYREELPERLFDVLKLLADLEHQPDGLECIRMVLRYVASGTDQMSGEELRGVVRQSLKTKGEDLMPTIAEQWVQEGREEGREEGLAEGRQKGIEQGEMIGRIRFAQEMLGQPVSDRSELALLEKEKLAQLDEQLQADVRRSTGKG